MSTKLFVNLSTYTQWPSVDDGCISNNGNIASYVIENYPIGSRTGVLVAIKNDWKLLIPNISSQITFTPDSKYALWINKGDSLGIIEIGNYKISYTPYVSSYEIKGKFIFYRPKNIADALMIKNARTNKTISFSSVNSYRISDNGMSLALLQKVNNPMGYEYEIKKINLKNGKLSTVWNGGEVRSFIMDRYGERIALIAVDSISGMNTIWYTKASGGGVAKRIYIDSSSVIKLNLKLEALQKFSEEGDLIFITLIQREQNFPRPVKQNGVNLDIWGFNDPKLQSYQLSENIYNSYTATVNVNSPKITQLEYANELVVIPNPSPVEISDTLVLIRKQENDGKGGEWRWNRTCKIYWYIASTLNGNRIPLDFINGNLLVVISPGRKFIVYYDSKEKNYFSYNIATKKIKNITGCIHEKWDNDVDNNSYRYRSIGGWEQGDATLLIYGKYDIWQIDPSGNLAPLCLTNNYGQLHHVIFSLALDEYNRRYLRKEELLILSAFNQSTKKNGFYQKSLDTTGDPDSLTMESRIYDTMNNQSVQNTYNFSPQKARYAKKYIIKRMSAGEAPNYFSTSDFRNFRPLSDLHPEKVYNWYTSELLTWKTLNQEILQGVLYKPENFDSSKKYPVIFHYYENQSDGLNAYLTPEALSGSCNINIPYYVSNGYIVFCPDIHFTVGDPMQGTFESLTSAVLYLSQFTFVDAKRIGLQGCSWGGIQTNYLVTQTKLFAAACSSSGMADWISGYGSIVSYGASLQGMYESGQFRMNSTLWEKPLFYIKNSPVLFADRISTPILLMHTKNDAICPFSNILEFYTALRRLGKRSWMLVYEGNHGIYGKEAVDFSIRMKQFFDHYLMDSLPPIWMTAGIPASLHGIKSGLELDESIKTPESNLMKNHK